MLLIKDDYVEVLGTSEELVSDYILHYLTMRKEHNDLLMISLSILDEYEKTGTIKDLIKGMKDPSDK